MSRRAHAGRSEGRCLLSSASRCPEALPSPMAVTFPSHQTRGPADHPSHPAFLQWARQASNLGPTGYERVQGAKPGKSALVAAWTSLDFSFVGVPRANCAKGCLPNLRARDGHAAPIPGARSREVLDRRIGGSEHPHPEPPPTGQVGYFDNVTRARGKGHPEVLLRDVPVRGPAPAPHAGTIPDLSLAETRLKAKDAFRDVAHDRDPGAKKQAERRAETFEQRGIRARPLTHIRRVATAMSQRDVSIPCRGASHLRSTKRALTQGSLPLLGHALPPGRRLSATRMRARKLQDVRERARRQGRLCASR